MTAYLIADVEIRDAETFGKYQQAVGEVIASHGGRYLVRGGESQVLEGDWRPTRLVVLEFPDLEHANAFWRSDDYAKIIDWRRDATLSKVVLVEGFTPPS